MRMNEQVSEWRNEERKTIKVTEGKKMGNDEEKKKLR